MDKSLRTGKRSAVISFLCGTIIFVLYFLTSWDILLFAGYFFIPIAALINLVIFIDIILKTKKNKESRSGSYKTCGLMMLNIPVMIIYGWIVLVLLGTMRITLTNTTQSELTTIKIIGCESKFIDKLMPGQSKTVWVSIGGDCSIMVGYLSGGLQKEETVASYVTCGMGQKMNYNIGDKSQKQF